MIYTYQCGDTPLRGYAIQRGIGVGGFGEVYLAASDAGKIVALKRVQRQLDVELRGVQRCLNLKHPNLVKLYDVQEGSDGNCWIIMEYMEGGQLAAVIERNPQGVPPHEVLPWLAGICEAVDYLHGCGIVHRDLKPQNIFIDEGVVKIGDYGLAKCISASRRSGHTSTVGSVHYMAPEIGAGRYGKEIDVYAVGVILFELLTGRPPFDGESAGEILMKHLTLPPDLSALPTQYRDVVAQALAKDPSERLQSLGDLRRALEAAMACGHAQPDRQAAEEYQAATVVHTSNLQNRETVREPLRQTKSREASGVSRLLPVAIEQLTESKMAVKKLRTERAGALITLGIWSGVTGVGCFVCSILLAIDLLVGLGPGGRGSVAIPGLLIPVCITALVCTAFALASVLANRHYQRRLLDAQDRVNNYTQRIVDVFPEAVEI